MIKQYAKMNGFEKHRLFFMVAAIGFAALSPVFGGLSFEIQAGLLGGLVLVLGMPHGALDPLIAKLCGADRVLPFGRAGFYIGYIAISGLALAFWLALPVAALVAFLVISMVHFSGDWDNDLPAWLRGAAGITLISHPCFFWPEEVTRLFEFLTFGAPAGWIVDVLARAELWICGVLYAGLGYFVLARRQTKILAATLEIGLIHLLSALFSPLVYFILYFCGCHSLRHFIETINELQDHGLKFRPVLKVAAFVSFATALMLAAGFWVAGVYNVWTGWGEGVVQIIFISLFVLTVPHMFLVGWLRHFSDPANNDHGTGPVSPDRRKT